MCIQIPSEYHSLCTALQSVCSHVGLSIHARRGQIWLIGRAKYYIYNASYIHVDMSTLSACGCSIYIHVCDLDISYTYIILIFIYIYIYIIYIYIIYYIICIYA